MAFKYTVALVVPEELVTPDFAARMGGMQIVNIRQRLSQGLNVNDSEMPAYSKATAKARRKKGRQTAYRDLTMSGRMVGDMHVADVRTSGSLVEAVIGFASGRGRTLALSHQARDPWFGISPRDRAALTNSIRESLPAEIQKNLKDTK